MSNVGALPPSATNAATSTTIKPTDLRGILQYVLRDLAA